MTIKREQRKIERTPKEQARIDALREKYQREKPGPDQLVASGEYDEPVQASAYWEVRRVMAELKSERERQGLTLAQLAERSGLDKGAISKLETGRQVNPTVDTLSRIAAGLGIMVGLTLKSGGEALAVGSDPKFQAVIADARRSFQEEGGVRLEDLRQELDLPVKTKSQPLKKRKVRTGRDNKASGST